MVKSSYDSGVVTFTVTIPLSTINRGLSLIDPGMLLAMLERMPGVSVVTPSTTPKPKRTNARTKKDR